MYDDKSLKKKVLDEVTDFLDTRESSRIQSSKKPTMEVDFMEVSAPKGSTAGSGADGMESEMHTGNSETSSDRDSGVAHGESPVESYADEDRGKAAMELNDDGSGLGDHEKEDLMKAYENFEREEAAEERDEENEGDDQYSGN